MNVVDAAKILEIFGDITPTVVKAAYRKACSKYHPDRNPAGEEMMKAVNAAYEALKDYTGTVTNDDESTNYSEELNDALNALIGLDGIELEICGSWVWITGNTKIHKETLKEVGCRWSRKKTAWYFRPDSDQKRYFGNLSLDEIRAKHGSQKVKNSRKSLKAA